MSDKTVRVKRGGEARLRIRVNGLQEKANAASEERDKRGYVDSPLPVDDIYALLKKGVTLAFYEITPSATAYHYGMPDIVTASRTPTLQKYQAIDAECVAAFTAGLTTVLNANAAQWVSQTYYFSGYLLTNGIGRSLMNVQQEPYGVYPYVLADQKEEHKAANKTFFKGLKRYGSILVGDDKIWRRFNTSYDPAFPGDSSCKITAEPSYTADRVTLNLNGGRTVKVFLKKIPMVASVESDPTFTPTQNPTDPLLLVWSAGLPLDVRNVYENPNSEFDHAHDNYWRAKAATSSHLEEQATTAAAAWDSYGGTWIQGAYGTIWTSTWTYDGEFVAGIEYQGRRYYVWRILAGAPFSSAKSNVHNYPTIHSSWYIP